MTKILLIRHGDTDNVDKVLAGRIDSPLNDEGVAQSLSIAEVLKHLSIDAIYASPLKRTQQTAQPLANYLHLDVNINNELNQVNFGDLQGLSIEELFQDPNWKIFEENPALAKIPGGEDGFMVRERVSTAMLKLINQYRHDAVIAIFSHGSIIRHTISYFIGLPLKNLNQIRIAPASISTLAISEKKGRLLHLNQELPVNWL
jgi:probable phosphoglycerate mutase